MVQTGNVGQSLTMLDFPTGNFAVAYRNQTAGSLQMIERTGGGGELR